MHQKFDGFEDNLSATKDTLGSVESKIGLLSDIQAEMKELQENYKLSCQRLAATVMGANSRFNELQSVLGSKISAEHLEHVKASLAKVEDEVMSVRATIEGGSADSKETSSADLAELKRQHDILNKQQSELRQLATTVCDMKVQLGEVQNLAKPQSANSQSVLERKVSSFEEMLTFFQKNTEHSRSELEEKVSKQHLETLISDMRTRFEFALETAIAGIEKEVGGAQETLLARMSDLCSQKTAADQESSENKISALRELVLRTQSLVNQRLQGIEDVLHQQKHSVCMREDDEPPGLKQCSKDE
jgi:hypothetical protein